MHYDTAPRRYDTPPLRRRKLLRPECWYARPDPASRWAITTATTVGYGDVVPHAVAGPLIAGALMLVGIGFLSMLTAAIASNFVSKDVAEEEHAIQSDQVELLATLRRIEERLERLEAKLKS